MILKIGHYIFAQCLPSNIKLANKIAEADILIGHAF